MSGCFFTINRRPSNIISIIARLKHNVTTNQALFNEISNGLRPEADLHSVQNTKN